MIESSGLIQCKDSLDTLKIRSRITYSIKKEVYLIKNDENYSTSFVYHRDVL